MRRGSELCNVANGHRVCEVVTGQVIAARAVRRPVWTMNTLDIQSRLMNPEAIGRCRIVAARTDRGWTIPTDPLVLRSRSIASVFTRSDATSSSFVEFSGEWGTRLVSGGGRPRSGTRTRTRYILAEEPLSSEGVLNGPDGAMGTSCRSPGLAGVSPQWGNGPRRSGDSRMGDVVGCRAIAARHRGRRGGHVGRRVSSSRITCGRGGRRPVRLRTGRGRLRGCLDPSSS